MKLLDVTPIGYERGAAFVSRARGCGLEDVRTPVYPASAHAGALHTLRRVAGLGLRDAASVLGLRAVELSALERGRVTPEDESEWVRMMETLELVAKRQKR